MKLEVFAAHSGAKQETSHCTPDGNCFVVVYNLDSFSLKMSGPPGILFNPLEIVVDTKNGEKCEDLSFKLKGFEIKIGVKNKGIGGVLVAGPKGLEGFLKRKSSWTSYTQKTESNE